MPTLRIRSLTSVAICLMFVFFGARTELLAQSGQLTLQVTPSSTQVKVGDVITVEGVILKDGTVSSLGVPQFSLSVQTSPGVIQDQEQPIFEPATPASITPGGAQSRATFTLTAVRAGTVTFHMGVNGETAGTTDNGDTVFFFTNASGRSAEVAVVAVPAEPVPIPEPLTITLFTAGLVGIAGYTRRRRR